MSSPRYKWWQYVKSVIREYPRMKEDLKELQSTSVVASYSGMPRGGDVSDPVAGAALRTLPKDEQKEFEAVTLAIERTRMKPNGAIILKMLKLYYWDQTHTLDGAGLAVGYQSRQARTLHGEFVRQVAKNLGFHPQDCTPEPEKCDTNTLSANGIVDSP